MSLTDEQRRRMNELCEAHRKRAKEREIARIKTEMTTEIADFSQKYEFANETVKEKLKGLLDELPLNRIGSIDFDKFPKHGEFSVENAEEHRVWFCSLCGSEEIFEIFVNGKLSDFLADYDDWYFYGAYMLLVYEDFGGFVYIDDNGKMTEAFFR